MKSKYQKFIYEQDEDFRKVIHKEEIPRKYINEDSLGISLEELERLDNQFIIDHKNQV